jgi:hypothetical protein
LSLLGSCFQYDHDIVVNAEVQSIARTGDGKPQFKYAARRRVVSKISLLDAPQPRNDRIVRDRIVLLKLVKPLSYTARLRKLNVLRASVPFAFPVTFISHVTPMTFRHPQALPIKIASFTANTGQKSYVGSDEQRKDSF